MIGKHGVYLSWVIACLAMLGSLYFSEIVGDEPCHLCWYQRICIFPLAIILGIAAFRNAYRIILYVLPLSLIGLGISLYHIIMIKFFAQKNFCPACTLKAVSKDPITFPLFSFFTFLLLNALLIWAYWRHKRSKKL